MSNLISPLLLQFKRPCLRNGGTHNGSLHWYAHQPAQRRQSLTEIFPCDSRLCQSDKWCYPSFLPYTKLWAQSLALSEEWEWRDIKWQTSGSGRVDHGKEHVHTAVLKLCDFFRNVGFANERMDHGCLRPKQCFCVVGFSGLSGRGSVWPWVARGSLPLTPWAVEQFQEEPAQVVRPCFKFNQR